jgi:polysaccharide export outer membrane protein
MKMKTFGWMVAAAAVAQAPLAMAQAPAPTIKSNLTDGYALGAGDVIEVTVLGRDEYKPRVQVQVDGTVQLPYIGNVNAENKTVLALREEIRERLKAGGYYANPAVNVMIVNYASRYIVVLGEVGTPGIVPIDRAYHVSEILARVGGTRSTGSDVLTLTRKSGETLSLSVSEVATGEGDKDPLVAAGDKLYVAAAKTFYIYGQVGAPGTYPVDREMNLRKALARSGGLTKLGSESRVKIIRKGQEMKGLDLNAPVQDGDVVVVGEKLF